MPRQALALASKHLPPEAGLCEREAWPLVRFEPLNFSFYICPKPIVNSSNCLSISQLSPVWPFKPIYHIFSSIMCIQLQCAPKFHNDFWENYLFYFSRIILQEFIIASLFIIKAILNPFSANFHVQCAGNISASFSM